MKIKVLHIFDEIQFSGAELMYFASAKRFQSLGVEMHALAAGKKIGGFTSNFRDMGIPVIHRPMYRSLKNRLLFIPYFLKFIRLCRDSKFQAVHIHRSHWFIWFALAAKIAGVPVVIRTVHNVFRPDTRYLQHYLDRFFSRIFGIKLTSISSSVEDNELSYFNNKTIRINNWYDSNRFYPKRSSNEKVQLRKELNLPEDKFILISVGSCLPQKGHKDILHALSKLQDTNFHYVHLGTGVIHDEELELAKELELQNQISYLGNKNNVRDYLVASDIYLMPSQFEGLGISAVEAMGCEIPCIFYDVVGLRDLIPDANHGFLINPSIDDLKLAIQTLYAKDDAFRVKITKKAKEFVDVNFDMDRSTTKFTELYKGVIK